jgi:heat shock protein HslJ
MKKSPVVLFAAACALAFAAFPAEAKKGKPAAKPEGGEAQQSDESKETGGIPRYQPFPHNQNFNLVEINGKAPPVEMWIRFDTTGRANGSSGCKNWSGVFAMGPERLGPRAMPAFTEQKCDPAVLAVERDFWNILLNGPYWETKGDELTLKAFKGGGSMRFQRSL